jgi:succinyl-CoA synthetase beta subunit
LASGLIDAVKELDVDIPVVIRMEGTNVNDGRSMLRRSGLNFTTILTMDEAASAVVALAADSK